MLAGIVAAANRDGYAAANVASVIDEAGVSRPTFYEYFSDRDACFIAAVLEIGERVCHEVRRAVARGPVAATASTAGVAGTAGTAIQALVEFAENEPAQARFLMSETLAGGPRTLNARDQSVGAIAAIIDQACVEAEGGAALPDLASATLVGCVYRLLAARLRRGERTIGGLSGELLSWIALYTLPAGEHRWRTAIACDGSVRAAPTIGGALYPPPPLPPGRPRLDEDAVAENHRLRIMFATAQLAHQQGYTATTIADITRLAGVDGRVFYRLFADKEQAFGAIHELGFQQLMASTAGAFFAPEQWPQRMWEALRALSGWLESNPTIASVGFVESYAVGPGAIQRVEDSLIAFTIFLEEGFQYRPAPVPVSRVGLEAIVTSVFEVLYRQIRERSEPEIAASLPALIHLSLTPFLGPVETDTFIEQMLRSERQA